MKDHGWEVAGSQRPELVAFSQYKIGGVQNFYFNILSNLPKDKYEIHWIFEEATDNDPKLKQLYGVGRESIFKIWNGRPETTYEMASRFEKMVPHRPGLVLANFWHDLVTLHLHRRPAKTIFFICHDEGYVPIAAQFEFLIDVFVAHNYQFFEEMKAALPGREKDIYFIPYGVKVPAALKTKATASKLRIVMAARMQTSKGVHDLPLIDSILLQKGIQVNWTIIGSGPEKQLLESSVSDKTNFSFHSPDSNQDVLNLMQDQDIFILPSRLDGLPVALLESMSMGCVPVISAFNEGIKKVVNSSVGFVLQVGDNNAFAEAIAYLDKHREELKLRGEKARTLIMEQYNIEVQVKKYDELFSRYKELKKAVRRKFRLYGGWLDLPFVPKPVRNFLRTVKKKVVAIS